MANPTNIECPADEWTKVIDGKTSGTITKLITNPSKYLYARRDAGDAAPVGVGDNGVVPFFTCGIEEEFGAKLSSDAYIYPIGADGEVMVDI